MDLTTWKAAAHKNLTRLAAQLDSLAPGMIYGALTSAALLPLVTAATISGLASLSRRVATWMTPALAALRRWVFSRLIMPSLALLT